MKSVIINNTPEKVREVFSDEILAGLGESACLAPDVYSKADVLSTNGAFSDTEYIFSTWGMPVFSEEEIARHFPRLKCVFYAAGTVQSFARPFLTRGVKVFSAWAANAVPVAEYTVSQILLANKGFFAYTHTADSRDRARLSQIKKAFRGNYGERAGLIGVGMIGSLVAKMLKHYNIEVLAFDPFLSEQRAEALGVKKTTLEKLFSSCSVVSNHLANNEQTKGMLDYALFSLMRPYATFINTGRGAQVVEADLVRALTERPDIIAVLDVTHPEPAAPEHPFHTLANCVLTPHIAGSLGDETHRMAEYMAEEYLRYISEQKCKYEVTLDMLATMA